MVPVAPFNKGVDRIFQRAPRLAGVAALVPVVNVGTEVIDVCIAGIPPKCRATICGVDSEAPARHRPHELNTRILLLEHRVEVAPCCLEVVGTAPRFRIGSGFGLVVECDPHVTVEAPDVARHFDHLVVQLRTRPGVRNASPRDDLPVVTLRLDRDHHAAVPVDNELAQRVVELGVPASKRAHEWQLPAKLSLEFLDRAYLSLAAAGSRGRAKEDSVGWPNAGSCRAANDDAREEQGKRQQRSAERVRRTHGKSIVLCCGVRNTFWGRGVFY